MKKFLLLMILGICISVSISADAEETNGYIFKVNSEISLFSANNSNLLPLGDGLYRAESIESIYNMLNEDDVLTVFPDYELELYDLQYPEITSDNKIDEQWNLTAISAEASRKKGVFGDGVRIAILDSGLNVEHDDLNKNKILDGYNCILGAEDTKDVSDNYGHGTKVTGIIASQIDNEVDIAGIASESYIIPLKITDGKTLKLSNLYTGIKKAIELDCDIINMSLGGALSNEDAIAEFETWIDKAEQAGIIVVAAVGNGGTAINYPAGFDSVVGVGSVDSNKIIAEDSQQNESVFVVAPGVDVLSLSKDGGTALVSGTSVATPHVTAMVALIKELIPDCTLAEVKQLLSESAEEVGDDGYDICYGYGIVSIDNLMEKLKDEIPEFVVSQGILNSQLRLHIHNNQELTVANGYFVTYLENRLTELNVLNNMVLKLGVSTVTVDDKYEYFFLWDDELRPFIPKYQIKK